MRTSPKQQQTMKLITSVSVTEQDIVIPPYIAQFLGYVMGRIHLALRPYSVLDILLPPIIIIMQEYSQALKTCKRL